MLELEPTRWFSWAFTVADDGQPLGTIDISAWRERGELTVAGQTFGIARKGFIASDFRLEAGGSTVATATRPSVLRREFAVTFSGRTLRVRPRSAWSRALMVQEGDREVGAVTPRSLWSRRATATLPDTLPVPVRMFVLWLALLIWKRDDDAAAA
jgi:hypothetical protein